MKSNILGTIFYNVENNGYDYEIDCDLLKMFINEGTESMTYYDLNDANYVLKVSKRGFSTEENFKAFINSKHKFDNIECISKVEYIGCLKHLLGEVYHPIFRQERVYPISERSFKKELIKVSPQFEKEGWLPEISYFTNGHKQITDLDTRNCGYDKDGNFKIIDYMYT